MIAFIDDHREAYGVEPICKVLPIAPSTYHAHVGRRADPAKRSGRAKFDDALKPEIRRVFQDNFQVYGVRKVWRQLRRENHAVARCTVNRLMRDMGLQGAIRGKPVRTTISDKGHRAPWTTSIVSSERSARMCYGSPTLLTSPPGPASFMSPLSLMPTRADCRLACESDSACRVCSRCAGASPPRPASPASRWAHPPQRPGQPIRLD